MQTFLPFPDFRESLECLDTKRLGKQRLETKQLINALENPGSSGWQNHPACKMWRGYIPALKLYHDVAISVWVERGYKNTMPLFGTSEKEVVFPSWLGNIDFHLSHQSNLLRKSPEHYAIHFLDVPHDLPYVWPTV